jgi:hypothetical protein
MLEIKRAEEVTVMATVVVRRSPITGETNSVVLDITQEQYERWVAGALIQDVMPGLLAWEREFLITGCTRADWRGMFPETDKDGE